MSLLVTNCHGYVATGVSGFPASPDIAWTLAWFKVDGTTAGVNRGLVQFSDSVLDNTRDYLGVEVDGGNAMTARVRTGNVVGAAVEGAVGFALWQVDMQNKWTVACQRLDRGAAANVDITLIYGRAASTAIAATTISNTGDMAAFGDTLDTIYVAGDRRKVGAGAGTASDATDGIKVAEIAIGHGSMPSAANIQAVIDGTLSPGDLAGVWEHWRLRNSGDGLVGLKRGITLAPFGGAATTTFDGADNPTVADPTVAAPTVSAPSAQTVTEPGTAAFSTTITGSSTGVQWQYSTDGGATSAGSVVGGTGATTTSYTTGATAVSTGNHRNGYRYRASVTWSGGTVESAWAALTVNAAGTAPAFSVQPGNQTGTVGSTATFTFTVTGSGSLTVQAKKGGTNVGSPFAVTAGASASYTTPTLLIGDNASSWTFEATGDTAPTATSSAATLTVLQPLATSITFTINGATSLTGLKWAWFDVVTPNLMTAAPTARGAAGTTDGSGVFTATITGTARRLGDVGYLIVTNSDGTTTQGAALRAFAGPATAS